MAYTMKRIAPIFEDLKQKYLDITFIEVDTEQVSDIIDKGFNINCLPTFYFYHNKIKIYDINGADKNKLIEYTENLKNMS